MASTRSYVALLSLTSHDVSCHFTHAHIAHTSHHSLTHITSFVHTHHIICSHTSHPNFTRIRLTICLTPVPSAGCSDWRLDLLAPSRANTCHAHTHITTISASATYRTRLHVTCAHSCIKTECCYSMTSGEFWFALPSSNHRTSTRPSAHANTCACSCFYELAVFFAAIQGVQNAPHSLHPVNVISDKGTQLPRYSSPKAAD